VVEIFYKNIKILSDHVHLPAIMALMMESASTSENSVRFCQTTRRNMPEDSHPHTCCRENLNSHHLEPSFVRKRPY
jgi:hypothetical protein